MLERLPERLRVPASVGKVRVPTTVLEMLL